MEFKKVKAEQAKAGKITEDSADGAEGKLKSSWANDIVCRVGIAYKYVKGSR